MEGRVEICISDVWGTICNGMWDNNDAAVVCRQLQLNSVGKYGIQAKVSLSEASSVFSTSENK